MTEYYVFESGSGKWVCIDEPDSIRYTSDKPRATLFNLTRLHQANDWFYDFSIYRKTLHAVPVGTNLTPGECQTVNMVLRQINDRETELDLKGKLR